MDDNGFILIDDDDNNDDTLNRSSMNDNNQHEYRNNSYNSGYQYTNNNQAGRPKYYNESYTKKNNRRPSLLQYILISLISAIIGGAVVFAAFVVVAPKMGPSMNALLGINSVNRNSTQQVAGDDGIYKKIEITESDSPVVAIAEKVSPSIIGVRVTVPTRSPSFFFDVGRGTSEGSGIIIRENGYILTNNHVIEAAISSATNQIINGAKIEVILPSQLDKPYTAQLVGRDSESDLAVIKIDADNLPAAELGDSDSLKVGELAVAIGNPGGLNYMGSTTAGVISGLNRTIATESGSNLTFIQTDAAINPGNSGGALVNSQGQVIGINTIKIAGGYEGLGFAIPINYAKEISENLIEYKYVKGRPYIGVSIDNRFNEIYAREYNVPNGLLVYDVVPLSPAYKAGIRSGDIIVEFDGVKTTEFSQLQNQKNKHKPGDQVSIKIYRDGKYHNLKLTLEEEKN